MEKLGNRNMGKLGEKAGLIIFRSRDTAVFDALPMQIQYVQSWKRVFLIILS